MDDLVNCSKCSSVPYDILMMNCNHNLCTKCAVERLDHQHSIKSIVGRVFIQCEKCKAKLILIRKALAKYRRLGRISIMCRKCTIWKLMRIRRRKCRLLLIKDGLRTIANK